MVWLYSHPDLVDPDNLNGFDRIFCASADFAPTLRAMGYENVEIMYACTSKRPVGAPVSRDVIFLGNARGRRSDGRSIVGHVGHPDFDFKVWGHRWEAILPAKYYGGPYWPYQKLEELYASARITLNDHHPDMAREGFVSNKVFDILASGGFVISDGNTGLQRLFGEAVPQYESPGHLLDLIQYYLNHPRRRDRLRRQGRAIALKHTYRDRAIRFLHGIRPEV